MRQQHHPQTIQAIPTQAAAVVIAGAAAQAGITDMRYAIRCCCTPNKVLGWIEGPADVPAWLVLGYMKWPGDKPQKHRIEVREFQQGHSTERAVYSEDRPIEFWRAVPGFQENTA